FAFGKRAQSFFHFRRKLLLELLDFRRHNELAVWLVGIVFVIFLVIVLSDKELLHRLDGGHDRVRPLSRRVQFGDDLFGGGTLVVRSIENDRAVLGADIVSLPIQRGWIVEGEKDLKQLAVAELVRIEGNAHYFHMAGIAGANLAICWIIDVPTHVTGFDRLHTFKAVKDCFQTPEASTAKDCYFLLRHTVSMHKRGRSFR